MVVYNVTVSIDNSIEEEWLEWMRNIHIPEVMATGFFRDSKLCRVHGEEEGGKTYAIMYTAKSHNHLEQYQEQFAKDLQDKHNQKFQGKFAAFRTLLSVEQEF